MLQAKENKKHWRWDEEIGNFVEKKQEPELPLNTIELPMDGAFKVILKVPRTMPQMVVASIAKQIRERKDARFLLLPENVKVIVIKKDGEAQVFGATIIP